MLLIYESAPVRSKSRILPTSQLYKKIYTHHVSELITFVQFHLLEEVGGGSGKEELHGGSVAHIPH